MKLPTVMVIAGPTASGKSALAVALARRFDGEIVSADSMQVYRGMAVATAQPTEAERGAIPHHLVGFLDPGTRYSTAAWCADAEQTIDDILRRGKLPIVCGGTGQYLSALLHNLKFEGAAGDEKLRAELAERAEREGGAALLDELRKLDPKSAETLHENDRTRIIRGLELAYSGLTKSEQNARSARPPKYDFAPRLLLVYTDRAKLYERIDRRVDAMLAAGLAEEADRMRTLSGATARQAIGHKELAPYLDGSAALSQCAEKLKQSTRNYAKRQMTWMRGEEGFLPIVCDGPEPPESQAVRITEKLLTERRAAGY